MVSLESAASVDALYAGRLEDVGLFEYRPRFTGDVLEDDGEFAIILQHPCAIRNGLELVDRLLMAKVEPWPGAVPSDWSAGHYKRFFLPALFDGGQNYSANFIEPVIWTSAQVVSSERRAVLSVHGVNLLLQRWVHHNTRVVVPSQTLNGVTAGPYEEAELFSDVCADVVASGGSHAKAEILMDNWLSDGHLDAGSRRSALDDPQQRAAIRQQARTQSKIWIEDRAAHD